MDDELIQPTLLRNKKTGRFLIVEPETRTQSDWGWDGSDERMVDYTTKHLLIRDSEYKTSQVLFCTCDPGVIQDLLKDGKCTSPCIEIGFDCYGNKFELSDLEAVTLDATPLIS